MTPKNGTRNVELHCVYRLGISPKSEFRYFDLILSFWQAAAADQASLAEPWSIFWRDVAEPKLNESDMPPKQTKKGAIKLRRYFSTCGSQTLTSYVVSDEEIGKTQHPA